MRALNFVLLVILLVNTATAQHKISGYDFCQMLKNDQSNLYDSLLTKEENDARKEKRRSDIIANFNTLMHISDSAGFPHNESDSCLNSLIRITFIHIAQNIHCELIFNKSTIDKLAIQLKKGNIDKDILGLAIIFYEKFGTRCLKDKLMIDYAMLSWDFRFPLKTQYGVLTEISYKECN